MNQKAKTIRIDYLKQFYKTASKFPSSTEDIPKETERDYKSSGKIEMYSVPLIIVICMFGIIAGYWIYRLIMEIALFIFQGFNEVGMCLAIILIPITILFLLSPLAVSTLIGFFIKEGAKFIKCRNSVIITVASVLTGLIGAYTAIHFSYDVIDNPEFQLALSDIKYYPDISKEMIIPCITAWLLDFLLNDLRFLWLGILSLIGFAITFFLVKEVNDIPFCEKTKQIMKKRVVKRIHLNNLKDILFFLLDPNLNKIKERIIFVFKEEKDSWDNLAHLELVVWTSESNQTNILELKAFYPKKDSGKSIDSRLIYSEQLSRSELSYFSQTLDFDK